MDTLELSYDTISAVPENFRSLFTEKDGKAVLTGINGLKTQSDVSNVQEALRKERADHAAAKEALKPWLSLGKKPDEVLTTLDRVAELEAAAAGKIDETKIQQIVENRLVQKTAPLERQLRDTTAELTTVKQERDDLKNGLQRRDMSDAIRAVATEMKVVPTAIADIELIAQSYLERDESGKFIVKAGVNGLTAGLDVKDFMKEMQKQRPHWWPASAGGGAGGGGGGFGGEANPWAANSWNMTAQGAVVREKGMAVAEAMAKAAGSKVGATRPTVKK
jgi:hypothetical protein